MAETDSLNPPSAPVESPEKHQRQGTTASGGRSKKGVRKRRVKTVKSRARASRPYPASSFKEATPIAEAIHQFASGQRVRRLTLLKQINKSPNSGPTKQLITNSGKYKLTTGSYAAEWLALTPEGSVATGPSPLTKEKLRAQFALAVKGIEPFFKLYDEYRGKKLPSHDVMKDLLRDSGVNEDLLQECVDTFIVNAKDLALLQTIAGSETLFPIESILDGVPDGEPVSGAGTGNDAGVVAVPVASAAAGNADTSNRTDWSRVCFVITAIGEEESEQRRHADLFLNALIEPALKEFGLTVVRADKIGASGMITSQVLEHVMRAKLAIVDLSFHNPNAFYEMALRHACGLPIVQITRRCDKAPFDVNQVRTVVVDTSDIYTLVPKLETYRSEIATHVRAALADGTTGNPITVFLPGVKVIVPPER
jgi:hypothetical protein